MSSETVFSSTRAVVASSFVKKIPCNIAKDEFLRGASERHGLVLEKSSDKEIFSFEGLWKDIIRVECFLKEHLLQWVVEPHSQKPKLKETTDQLSCMHQKGNGRKPTSIISAQSDLECEPSASVETGSVVTKTQGLQTNTSNNAVYSLIVNDKYIGQDTICISEVQGGDKMPGQEVSLSLSSIVDSSFSRGNEDDLNSAKTDKNLLNHENEIYMDIKLSCRPCNGLFKDSRSTPVTVVMGTEESLVEAVCLDSTNGKEASFDHIAEPKLSINHHDVNEIGNWRKTRSRRYEEKAQYKFFCTQCSFKTKRQSHLKKHALLHERVCKLYSCEHCDFSTIRLGHLQRHVIQHSELQLSCSVCSYKTHSKTLLRRHLNLKHKVGKLSPQVEMPQLCCTECNYSTTKEKLFHRHQIVHSGSKHVRKGGKTGFECGRCPFKTTTKSNLARHSNNVHDGDRPFLCNVCGQGFKRSDTLTQHLVVHASSDSSMDDLQCPHCRKFYRSKSLLHEHILVHSDTRSYLCEMCGAAFKTRAVQRKHVRMVHANSKLFPCSHCSKKFNSRFAVKRHMKLHEQKKVHDVPIKQTEKSTENTLVALSNEWRNPVMALPVTDDVQVLVVQDSAQHGVLFNEGAIYVQDSTEVEMESSSSPSKAVNVPILPLEYVLPEVMTSQICTGANLGTQFAVQDGEVITLQFVQ